MRVDDNIYNVRDIGGHVTSSGKTLVQGIAYRGGTLMKPAIPDPNYYLDITEAGKTYMSEVMRIKTEIDLRTPGEAGITPEQGSVISGTTLSYNAINAYGDTITNTVDDVNNGKVTACAKILKIFANAENYPIYIHCSAGADRTGTIVFLLHALLGVSELECVQDYELTSFAADGLRNTQGNFKAKFDALRAGLAQFDENGTLQEQAESWARYIGVTQAEIDSIRAIFAGEVAVNANVYNPNVSSTLSAKSYRIINDLYIDMSQVPIIKNDAD